MTTTTDRGSGSGMSDLDLDAIKARCEAATPGEWYVDRGGEFDDPYYSIPSVCRDRYGDNSLMVGSDKATAEFIAHARTDVPALVAEVERWKERAEVAKAAFQVQTREVERLLRVKLKEAHLLRIEAQNPGIDMDEVRRHCCE